MESITSPSYSSVVGSLPRLRGDGMDSDNLKPKTPLLLGSSPPNPPPPRHRNLNSSTKAATIAKTQKPKHVPKEPTKGAVGHIKPRYSQEYTTAKNKRSVSKGMRSELNGGQSQGPVSTDTVSLTTNKIVLAPSQEPTIPTQNFLYGNLHFCDTSENRKEAPTSNSTNTPNMFKSNLEQNNKVPFNTSSVQSQVVTNGQRNSLPANGNNSTPKIADVTVNMELLKHVIMSNPGRDEDKGREGKRSKKNQDSVAVTMSPPPTEEREIEGESQCVNDRQLQNKVDSLTQELEQQAKVNTDLKKLLVASVGDDLHWKMDALVQTKTQLASEIGDYTEKMRKDYEELDTLSIQADMWKSKFMATRVLIDQLSTDSDNLLTKNQESERALKHLMQERQELHSSMVETHRYLKLLRDSFDPVFAQRMESVVPNILELARTNRLLSEAIKTKLLGNMPLLTVALDSGIQNGLTPAEKMAHQILISDIQLPRSAPGRLSTQHAAQFGRFHPHVREERLHWTCCRNCSGDVHIV